MRTLAPFGAALAGLAALAVVALAFHSVARAAPDGQTEPAPEVKVLEAQVKALQADVAWLRAREAALTRYAVGLESTSKAILAGVSRARVEGFEAAAVPAASRTTVLSTLEDAARGVATGLPRPAADDERLRRAADDAHKAADALATTLLSGR